MSESHTPIQNEENQSAAANSTPSQPQESSTLDIPVRKELSLNYISVNYLKEIAKWTKFISIVGFVMVGIMVLVGVLAGSIFSAFSEMIPSDFPQGAPNPSVFGGVFGVMYVIMAGIYFFPVYYLFNFSSKLKSAIQENNEAYLAESFKNLKSHYKFLGILLIIGLAFYALMFLFIGGIGAMAGSMF